MPTDSSYVDLRGVEKFLYFFLNVLCMLVFC